MSVSKAGSLPQSDGGYQSGRNSPVGANSAMTLRSSVKKGAKKSSDTPKINVISFTGDLSERLQSIGLQVTNVKNFTIKDIKKLDIDSDDDEDYKPYSNDEPSGLSSKTKMVIGTVLAIAVIVFGFYLGSRSSSDSSEQLKCVADTFRAEKECSKTIKSLKDSIVDTVDLAVKNATDQAKKTCEGFKLEAYKNGKKDSEIIHRRAIDAMDAVLDVKIPGEKEKTLLGEMLPSFIEEVVENIKKTNAESISYLTL